MINLSATEATGGTPPITHQWARQSSFGGGYLDIGSNSLSVASSGLVSGSTYTFRLTYTDSVGQTAVTTYTVTLPESSSATDPILFEPFALTLVNVTGQDYFSLADTTNSQTMQVKISDGNPLADWTSGPYGIDQINVALVSVNEDQIVTKAALLKSWCSIVTPIAETGVTVNVVFSSTDLASLPGKIYYAYATVLFSSGQIEVFGRVRVERN
jgi:hypothetical protein